jgi:glutathionyl-hydroquinone reductase
MANIYQGRDSCYAKKERTYITGSKVTPSNMKTFVRLIRYDLKRGWTYDHSCRRIKMSKKLAIRRLAYLKALCIKHTGQEEACDRAYERDVAPVVLRLSGKKIIKPKKRAKRASKKRAAAVARRRR